MFKTSDVFILSATAISFAVSGFSYFSSYRTQTLLTAILAFGIHFKKSMLLARGVKT